MRRETSESVPTETGSREEQRFGEGVGGSNHCLHNGVITLNSRGAAGRGGVDRSSADRSSSALINSECYYATPSFDALPCAVDGLRLRRSFKFKTFLDSQEVNKGEKMKIVPLSSAKKNVDICNILHRFNCLPTWEVDSL